MAVLRIERIERLLDRLSGIAPLASRKPAITPGLQCAMLYSGNGMSRLAATNLEIGFDGLLEGAQWESGERIFVNIPNALKALKGASGPAILQTEGALASIDKVRVLLSGGRHEDVETQANPDDELPAVPSDPEGFRIGHENPPRYGDPFTVVLDDPRPLSEALARAARFVRVEVSDGRYGLAGAYIHKAADGIAVVGCNTHVLYREVVPWRSGEHGADRSWDNENGVLLTSPGIAAKALSALSGSHVTMRMGAGYTVFSDSAGSRLSVRHLEYSYPRYAHLIPDLGGSNPMLAVDRKALLSELKRLPKNRMVRFWPCDAGKKVKVCVYKAENSCGARNGPEAELSGPEHGLATFKVPAFSPRMKCGLSLYVPYLIDVMGSFEELEIRLNSNDSSVVTIKGQNRLALIAEFGSGYADHAETLTPEDLGAESLEAARMLPIEPVRLAGTPKKASSPRKRLSEASVLDWMTEASLPEMNQVLRVIELRRIALSS